MDRRELYFGRDITGFPSPAKSGRERSLNLNDLLLHPSMTFFVSIWDDSMREAGISRGDLLIVDRALSAMHNSIIVATLNETFLVKRIQFQGETTVLKAEHPDHPMLEVTPAMRFQILGVVTSIMRGVHPSIPLTTAITSRTRRRASPDVTHLYLV